MAYIQHIYSGVVAPSTAPLGLGHHYINTANGDVYTASGTSSVADWIKTGSPIREQTITFSDTTFIATIDGVCNTVNIDYIEAHDAGEALIIDLPDGLTSDYQNIHINFMATESSASAPTSISFSTSSATATVTVDAGFSDAATHIVLLATWSNGVSNNGSWLVTLIDSQGTYPV